MTVLKVTGTGSSLPSKLVTNQDMEDIMDTSHEWIVARTGIEKRYFCAEGESTSTLATAAAKEALKNAGVDGKDVDLVVVATSTPDLSFPGVAVQVQAEIEAYGCAAFDVQAVCSGFLYALSTAEDFLKNGKGKTAVVIGADTFSNLLDMEDRTTAVLFGDGAGAVVLQVVDTTEECGLLGVEIHADGRHVESLRSTGGVATTKTAGVAAMNGREVFRHAVRVMSDIVEPTLKKFGVKEEEISWLVPHQANKRIIEAMAKMLKLPMDKVILTVNEHANTSAASIPLALHDGVKKGQIKKGDVLFLEGFGAGFTWGSAVIKW